MALDGDDSVTVFFASTLKQVTRNPGLVASALGAFSEYLEFPLACGHSVNAFYVNACFKHKSKCSSMQSRPNALAAPTEQ